MMGNASRVERAVGSAQRADKDGFFCALRAAHCALKTNGEPGRDRTYDQLVKSQLLYR